MDDKLIVTNRSALIAKYKSAGLAKVKAAIDAMIAADATRGIKSRLVYLDNATAMKKYKGKAVTDAGDVRQVKAAIDAIFKAGDPEYLMILGAPDVVPHGDMTNPVFDPPDDDDEVAWGDLPYACDAPYARDIAKFKGPTRVVGRLPDLRGAKEPSHLVRLLDLTTKHKRRDVTEYSRYFGLSTHSWRKSSALSLFNTFGNSTALLLAPPAGPTHPAAKLAPRSHFINCHGGPSDPQFYGEKGTSQPVSLTSKSIAGKIKPGTVAAVECCYGGELYDSVTLALPLPICQHYLIQGTAGYFGSTTIAYGPEEGNGAADLITQYFLMAILEGASLGRAALLARQRFVQQTGELDPVDLKTLAQFNLLGDPSVTPASVESPTDVPKGGDAEASRRILRRQRRAKLREVGDFLENTKPTASRRAKRTRKSPTVQRALANIAREAGFGARKPFTAYDVKLPPGGRKGGAKAATTASRYFVAVYRRKAKPGTPREHSVAAVAKEVDGRIIGYRIYREK